MHKSCLVPVFVCFLLCAESASSQTNFIYDVRAFGAVGDGRTDDTPAFQRALDAAGQNGGGTVQAGRGNFFFAGHLTVPKAVALCGIWKSVPSHVGMRDQGFSKATDDGTTFLVTENMGNEDGPGFITLGENGTLSGMVVYYPNQKPDETPAAYPWAVVMRGKNPAVLDVELLNAYNGIDASRNERHLIRNVSGQPLRRGIYVDDIMDIGRIENVHFNPWWSTRPAVLHWQQEHGEAFIIGRSDWQYMLDTFCFGYNIGYKFIHTGAGECNGNFLGLGADDCYTAVEVEDSAPYALLINNGEFVSFHGPNPTMVRVRDSNRGVVRFSNCAFWGPCNQIAEIAGRGTVGFSDCTFVDWDHHNEGRAAIQATGGSVLVRGCEFRQDKPQIDLGPEVKRAVISDNLIRGKIRIANHASTKFQIHDNGDNESEMK